MNWIPVTEKYPEMLGPGIPSAPVLVWMEDKMLCPLPCIAVANYWKSTAPKQPHKWYYDGAFYGMEMSPPRQVCFEVTHWCPFTKPEGA